MAVFAIFKILKKRSCWAKNFFFFDFSYTACVQIKNTKLLKSEMSRSKNIISLLIWHGKAQNRDIAYIQKRETNLNLNIKNVFRLISKLKSLQKVLYNFCDWRQKYNTYVAYYYAILRVYLNFVIVTMSKLKFFLLLHLIWKQLISQCIILDVSNHYNKGYKSRQTSEGNFLFLFSFYQTRWPALKCYIWNTRK